jgi:hypothetical protein
MITGFAWSSTIFLTNPGNSRFDWHAPRSDAARISFHNMLRDLIRAEYGGGRAIGSVVPHWHSAGPHLVEEV